MIYNIHPPCIEVLRVDNDESFIYIHRYTKGSFILNYWDYLGHKSDDET